MLYLSKKTALVGSVLLASTVGADFTLPVQTRSGGSFKDYRRRTLDARGVGGNSPVTGDGAQGSHYITLNIGGQDLPVDMDTGSNQLWCFTPLQPQGQWGSHRLYDPRKSSTYKATGGTFSARYSDGTGVSGTLGTETVSAGNGVVARDQSIGIGTDISVHFDDKLSCLMGMSYNPPGTVNDPKNMNFFDTIKPTLSQPLFTVDINDDDNHAGAFGFGFIDESRFTSDIGYAPLTGDRSWQFRLTSYSFGNGPARAWSTTAIPDTGTTFMNLPQWMVNAYMATVPGSHSNDGNFWQVPCSANLPDITLGIQGGGEIVVRGKDIGGGQGGAGMCQAQIFGAGDNFTLLGDTMFKSNFVVFDANPANPRVGFARKGGPNTKKAPRGAQCVSVGGFCV